MPTDYYPILGKAEALNREAPYGGSYNPVNEIRTLEEACDRLLPQLDSTIDECHSIDASKRLRSGTFFAVDLDFKYLAKSYFPHTFFENVGWELAGSIRITQNTRDGIQLDYPKQTRRLFFKATTENIVKTRSILQHRDFSNKTMQDGPKRIDRISIVPSTNKLLNIDQVEDDLLEVIVHPLREEDWQEFLDKLYRIIARDNYPNKLFKWVMGGQVNMPRFVPVQAAKSLHRLLADLNPVRAIRPMPGVSYPRMSTGRQLAAAPPPTPDPMRSGPLPSVGVFDGGVDTTIPHLGRWVIPVDLTTTPPHPETLQHGTAVCGALLYGMHPDKGCDEPSFTVKSFRVFPEPFDTGFPGLGLYKLVKLIEDAVRAPENANIKTYVLSFGPDKPIDDEEVDLFTATLDRLAFENDILFVVAVGNTGELSVPYNRIQPPADTVNGLGVGAYIYKNDQPIRAPYSSTGPGRSGNAVKPDIHMFGGGSGQPFCVFEAGGMGKCTESMGTSFSAPLACSFTGNLLYRVDDQSTITPQTAKALMIHRAFNDGWDPQLGWGPLSCSVDELMLCTQSNVTLLYNGNLPLRRRTLLQVPFFQDIANSGKVRLSWTLVYATDVSPSMPDEYTLGGADVSFRPNCDVFSYTLTKGDKKIVKRVDRSKNPDEYNKLIRENKLKLDTLPKTSSPLHKTFFLSEEDRRDIGVWDTTKHFWTGWHFFKTLKNPVIDIHAQARSDWYYDKARPSHLTYACVVSIETDNKELNLYKMIRERVPSLVEVRLRTKARVRV